MTLRGNDVDLAERVSNSIEEDNHRQSTAENRDTKPEERSQAESNRVQVSLLVHYKSEKTSVLYQYRGPDK